MDEVVPAALRVLDVVSSVLRVPNLSSAQIVVLEKDQAIIELPKGRVARILALPSTAVGLTRVIDHALSHNEAAGTELVLVGGGSPDQHAISSAIPKLRMSAFFVHHVSVLGKVNSWPGAKGSVLRSALEQCQPVTDRQEQELFEKASFDQARDNDEQRERIEFFQRVKGRGSPVTFALLAAIFVMFALQLRWSSDVMGALGLGDSSHQDEQYWLFLAVSMGALWTPSVLDGEVWRAISVGFLHFNLMHIAANSFVLYVLGSQIEKVLGSSRFLIIYTVALLGGSLASTFLTEGVAVGASGAIWGLLGAQVALAYGRPPVLPASIARAMKPMAMRNLVLNVGISFIGGIDWAAHFGGGLFGGAILASGLLYPNLGRVAPTGEQGVAVVWAARGAALLLILGVLTSLWVGQPWRLSEGLPR
jgi:membrane associated rhomboid family serine protease